MIKNGVQQGRLRTGNFASSWKHAKNFVGENLIAFYYYLCQTKSPVEGRPEKCQKRGQVKTVKKKRYIDKEEIGHSSLETTTITISQLWRRFRHQAWMRFKRRNVLYVPGVGTVHGSTYAPSSVRQRHSRAPHGRSSPRALDPPTRAGTPHAREITARGGAGLRSSFRLVLQSANHA